MANKKLVVDSGKGITTVESNEIQNYIENSTARLGTTGWTVYATSSASATPSNFGGTPNGSFTHARNTSSPLRSPADFLLTKDAANRQGHGVYYSFDLDLADRGQVLNFEIKHKESANYVDGDIRVYLVTSSDSFSSVINVIEGSVRDLSGWGGTSGSTFLTSFQTNSTDTKGRLCLHVAGTGATAWTLNHIEARLGRDFEVYTSSFIGIRYSSTSTSSISNTANLDLPYATKVYDTHNAFDGTTFTTPQSGYYSIETLRTFNLSTSTAGGYLTLRLYVNGSIDHNISTDSIEGTASQYVAVEGATTLYLAAGSLVKLNVLNQSGSSKTLLGASSDNWISISKIG